MARVDHAQEQQGQAEEDPTLLPGDLDDILASYSIDPIRLQRVIARIAFLKGKIASGFAAVEEAERSAREHADRLVHRQVLDGENGNTKRVVRKSVREAQALADTVERVGHEVLSGQRIGEGAQPTTRPRSRSIGLGALPRRLTRTLSSGSGAGKGNTLEVAAESLIGFRELSKFLAEVDRLVAAISPAADGGALEKLDAVFQALSDQRAFANYITSRPTYHPIELVPIVQQKVAKILRHLEKWGRRVVVPEPAAAAGASASAEGFSQKDYERLKAAAQLRVEALIPGFSVKFLGGGNGIVARFLPLPENLDGKPFVMNLIVLQRDLINQGRTCLDARRKLFLRENTVHATAGAGLFADLPTGNLFERFATPFYSVSVPVGDLDSGAAAAAGTSDSYYDGMDDLSDVCLDGVLCLQASECLGQNLADQYHKRHMAADREINIVHRRSAREEIAKNALKDACDLLQFFGRLSKAGFVYTDIKPQNVLEKFGDIKGLAEIFGDIQVGVPLPAMDVSPRYSDDRVDARTYKPELCLKIGIIAFLYHCCTGAPAERVFRGPLIFKWDDYPVFSALRTDQYGSLGEFLDGAYKDNQGYSKFFLGLSAFNEKYNPSPDPAASASRAPLPA